MAASKPKTKLDMKPFPSHMTLEDAMKLSANDTIDHRDSVGRFAIATVSEKNGLKLKIHYNGWGPQYDTCVHRIMRILIHYEREIMWTSIHHKSMLIGKMV
eukprot:667101_1